jgi:CRP-like cAMP-binding protein
MRVTKGTFNRHVKEFGPGEIIFKETDPGREMYVIISGKVEIQKSTTRTASKTLTVLGSGDIFGEMAIIDKKKRSATAVTLEPTKLLVLDETLFEATLERNPDFARKMIRILSERLRRTNAALQNSLGVAREHHIMNGLVQYSQEFGVSTFKGKRFHIQAFLDWASHHIGINEEDIRPTLEDFMKRGVLKPSARGGEEVLFKAPKTA